MSVWSLVWSQQPIVVNSFMSAVKVTGYSSLMKFVIVQNLRKFSFFQTLVSPFVFLKEKGLRYKLSSTAKQQNSFQKHKCLYSNLYNFIDSIYFSVSQTHVQNVLKRFLASECSFQSRIQRATNQLRFGKGKVPVRIIQCP